MANQLCAIYILKSKNGTKKCRNKKADKCPKKILDSLHKKRLFDGKKNQINWTTNPTTKNLDFLSQKSLDRQKKIGIGATICIGQYIQCLLYADFFFSLHDNGGTIRIGQEIQRLMYAGFFLGRERL